MSNMTLDDAQARFRAIASAPYACPIRTGFAELGLDDSAEDLIARADGQLVDGRGAHHTRSQPDGETDR